MKILKILVEPSSKLMESTAGLCSTAMTQMPQSMVTSPNPTSMTGGLKISTSTASIISANGVAISSSD
jgi:hypothetical protein